MKTENIIPREYVNEAIKYMKKARTIGAMEYIISDVLQKVLAFCGTFLVVRILSKEDYGIYTYVLNVFSILSLFADFGVSSSVLQYASVYYLNENKRNAFIRYGFRCLHAISLISLTLIGIASFVFPFAIDAARDVFWILILLPVLNNEIRYYQTLLRVELKNKEYAYINLISTTLHYLLLIGLTYYWGINGAILSSYPRAIIVLLIYIYTVKLNCDEPERESLSKQEKINFWKFGFFLQVNAVSLILLNYLDIYCLGVVAKNPGIIAEYKVASAIPAALHFIPGTIMFFLVPIIGRHKNDFTWTIHVFKKIILTTGLICSSIAIIMASLSDILIRLFYGNQYVNSVPCYLVLLVGFVAYGILQAPASNLLVIQEKMKVVMIASIGGALINIVLNFMFINQFGSIGAAIATTFSYIVVGGILTSYFIHYVRKNMD